MNVNIAELTTVLEEEIALAEELSRNLADQKAAIVAWDALSLLQELERKEQLVRSLTLLEQRRTAAVMQIGFPVDPPTLRQLIGQLPSQCPERAYLSRVRERADTIFTRLRSEEQDLSGLMERLLAHIQGALSPLVRDTAPVYTENGAAESNRAIPALVQSKA